MLEPSVNQRERVYASVRHAIAFRQFRVIVLFVVRSDRICLPHDGTHL